MAVTVSPSGLISCTVPVYNGERYLAETLQSILAQTHQPLELIVVDDGSTDATPAVVADFGDRIRYVRQENAGPSAARNHGIKVSNGDFIAFLDADDLWHPEKLARQMVCFRKRPELQVVVTHLQNFWVPEVREEAERMKNHRLAQPLPCYTPVSMLARRSVFDSVGLFNEKLRRFEDTDWFLRARDSGVKMELMPDVLVRRRFHEANVTRTDHSRSREAALKIVQASLARRRGKPSKKSSD
jgi:glycosyltransferase involved in cell wall biosynthesis